MSETTVEEKARQLVTQLSEILARQEDAESAVTVYKSANWVIQQLEEVKSSALALARQDIEERGVEHLKTQAGSAGWTEPRTRKLNEQAWRAALAVEPSLFELQRNFDAAQAALEQAQTPYLELSNSRFYIR